MQTIKDVLDLVEQRSFNPSSDQVNAPDREILLSFAQAALEELAAEDEFEFFQTLLDPAIVLTASQRNYKLPKDFGANFVKGKNSYLVQIRTGSTSEQTLTFLPVNEFFQKNLTGETSTGIPTYYTIVAGSKGKEFWVSPKPDSNATYTIWGIYQPAFLSLREENVIPIPNGGPWLAYAIAAQFDPKSIPLANAAKTKLYLKVLRNRNPQISPPMEDYREAGYYTSK